MKLWNSYTAKIKSHCTEPRAIRDLAYWRNDLFAGIIIYLLPTCLIALIPGLYFSFSTRQYLIALIDIVALGGIVFIGFAPGISLCRRKILFIIFVYAFSCAMLFFLGVYGPAIAYLLTACVFSVLILSSCYPLWSAWLNTLICVLFSIALWLDILPWAGPEHTVNEWIAISANLIFLSFLISALLPKLFNGLQETLSNEKLLQNSLKVQQKHLQETLEMLSNKNSELEQFAYVASHDLKEPLRMVTSFMDLLKKKYAGQLDDKAHRYIDFALDGGKRMQNMVSSLLELSRAGRNGLNKEWLDVNELLIDVRKNIYKLVEDKKAEIAITGAMPTVYFNKEDLMRLLQNLLSNAIKFSRQDTIPVIEIKSAEKEGYWLFSMEDNGIGIEEENQDMIFEVFTRLHPQAGYDGTGIGLAICKKIVEHYGGKIWVQPKDEKGAIFYFTVKI